MSSERKPGGWKRWGGGLGRLIATSVAKVLITGLVSFLIYGEFLSPAGTPTAPIARQTKLMVRGKATRQETGARGGALVKTRSTATVKAVIEDPQPGSIYRFRAVFKGGDIELDAQDLQSAKGWWARWHVF